MRKFAIVLAALIAASLTTSAEAAGKKKSAAAPKPAPAAAGNENTRKLFHDAFHIGAPKAAEDKKGGKKKGKRA
jgi:hypothetical protein